MEAKTTTAAPTFEIENCRDLRDKLWREFNRYKGAVGREDAADHAFNFMVTAWHMCDWFARDVLLAAKRDHPKLAGLVSPTLKESTRKVQVLACSKCPDLEICQSFANASKHAEGNRHTRDVLATAKAKFPDDVPADDFVALVRAIGRGTVEWEWRVMQSPSTERSAAMIFAGIYQFWHDFIDEYLPTAE